MVEETKASQGASVSKTANMGAQSSLTKSKAKWDQQDLDSGKHAAQLCQDTSDSDPPSPMTSGSSRAKKPAAKQEISEQIGRQLRSVYNDVLAQPVPDRFLDLLRALEKDPK